MNAREWTAGRWPEIISSLIGPEYTDGRHHPCPSGAGKDCFRFSNINGRGNYFCRCSQGQRDGFDLIQCHFGCDFVTAVKYVEEVIGPRPREIEAQPRKQTFAERLRCEVKKTNRSAYLEARGLILPPSLDWHPSVKYWHEGTFLGTFPAMLAPVTRGKKFLTYHATYLGGGRKASVPIPRKILPASGGIQGAAVELFPPEPTLGVAEGIETAIAAHMLFDVPVWALLSTSGMKSWRPPAGVRRVLIFGDNDPHSAGQAAAYSLAHCLHGTVETQIHLPPTPGDWNDVLLQERIAQEIET